MAQVAAMTSGLSHMAGRLSGLLLKSALPEHPGEGASEEALAAYEAKMAQTLERDEALKNGLWAELAPELRAAIHCEQRRIGLAVRSARQGLIVPTE